MTDQAVNRRIAELEAQLAQAQERAERAERLQALSRPLDSLTTPAQPPPTPARPSTPTEETPTAPQSPSQRHPPLKNTPFKSTTYGIQNALQTRNRIDIIFKEEIRGFMFQDINDFDQTFLRGIADLESASDTFFGQCTQGNDPFFDNNSGWKGWPPDANERAVRNWLSEFVQKLSDFAARYKETHRAPTPAPGRRLMTDSTKSPRGSDTIRKLDLSFVRDTAKESSPYWSEILLIGELKSNPKHDNSDTKLQLGSYAREVFRAQQSRRFVLGFTICGSFMRMWEFDRLGAVGSDKFDLNDKESAPRFVSVMLSFLWMNEQQLGFDPTIQLRHGKPYAITIHRHDQIGPEYLFIDSCVKWANCVAGRATVCWQAHRDTPEGVPLRLVIKDSWQYVERDEEGELLQKATEKGVGKNVAQHYYHQTVQVNGEDDEIWNNVRKGLDATKAKEVIIPLPKLQGESEGTSLQPGSSTAMKRSSGLAELDSPPEKRLRSGSGQTGKQQSFTSHRNQQSGTGRSSMPPPASKQQFTPVPPPSQDNTGNKPVPNRVHRRVVVTNFGLPIYKASTPAVLLRALAGCINGHRELYEKAGILHRDISANNLMINEENGEPYHDSFLIDLDLAIDSKRIGPSGAPGITGTLVFMAIGILRGETHSFMHDLESFFWVLFWICVHYTGSDTERNNTRYTLWNFSDVSDLADRKTGVISVNDQIFLNVAEQEFTPYYRPLVSCVNELRKVVFPNRAQWEQEDPGQWSSMIQLLKHAADDLERGAK